MTPPIARRIRTALPRIKRSHGFGIHSPFAFAFVLKVLMERCPFYAYSDIAAARAESIRLAAVGRFRHRRVISLKNAKMVFRIAVHARPQAILQIGTSYGVTTVALAAADSRTPIVVATLRDAAASAAADNVYRDVTAPYSSRISEVATIREARALYSSLLPPSSRPFVVINAMPSTHGEAESLRSLIHSAIDAEGYIIMRNISNPALRDLWLDNNSSATSHGMSFSNGKIGVFVALSHLPRQSFSLWF